MKSELLFPVYLTHTQYQLPLIHMLPLSNLIKLIDIPLKLHIIGTLKILGVLAWGTFMLLMYSDIPFF